MVWETRSNQVPRLLVRNAGYRAGPSVMLGMQPLDVLRTVNAPPTLQSERIRSANLAGTPGCVVLTDSREMRLIRSASHDRGENTPARGHDARVT